MTTPATWFVTGTSRGLGLELVRQLLEAGHNVTATTRSTERLTEALAGVDTSRLLALEVDLADETAVADAVRRTTERFSRLDVVVNNAGYGFLASVEDTTDADARRMFDVQVFGVWNVLRAVLPIFRTQKSGHVVNVSSVLGLVSVPGWGLYCAGKFALEGMSEALAAEVAEFGVKVTLVEPGYFRTSFLTTDSLALPTSTTEGYEAIRQMTDDHLNLQGSQLGDPVKGAAAIISLVASGDGPLRRLLGSDAYSYATGKVRALQADIEAGRELAHSTDFPQS
ncbi:SDR family NAD(P)-dependent oxidoreductase [Herbidospora sp. NEAU-GS84]|uniref:SDR family NAD(P)-dependent oxidoreductase n=1 Tax=Herbidospora solisilvae TaxID=2696284 RepID=A0A7C9J236_9ACTN|nr:SDR family NAD(P)-dependent oxidoreductase [Herbidospora solisilvae]NAS22382.1 SDR family NAD(P)-dependent oxidoreductase [Herbidospora solisilvae]